MFSSLVFFSFTEVPDPTRHREYNEWHQLDHRPENLALPGVQYGERWVLAPDCVRAGVLCFAPLDALHYVNMYWFAHPVEESFSRWQDLAERSFQWGRRPDVRIARRLVMGTFAPVNGMASSRVLVSPEALLFRPNRGIELTVTRPHRPHDSRTEAHYGWENTVLVPHLLARDAVAGVWTFSSQSTTLDAEWQDNPDSATFDPRPAAPGQLRIRLVYLDDDPIAYRRALDDLPPPCAPSGDIESLLFQGVLRAITPWEWDWFDLEQPPNSR